MTRRPAARAFHEVAIADAAVASVFEAYPADMRERLLALRALILDTAVRTPGVGRVQETLKWGQPSYLTAETGSGTTVRIDRLRDNPRGYALYVSCQTNLIETFRRLYAGELRFEGDRAILFEAGAEPPAAPLRHCIALALTYHSRRKAQSQPRRLK